MKSKNLLYTDGGFSKKTGNGGFGFIAQHLVFNQEYELFELKKEAQGSGIIENTTSNRAELVAVIKGLLFFNKPCDIEIISDSTYVVNTINTWLPSFIRDPKRLNYDLMLELNEAIKKHKSVVATWTRGHSTCIEHNRTDELAKRAAGTWKGK